LACPLFRRHNGEDPRPGPFARGRRELPEPSSPNWRRPCQARTPGPSGVAPHKRLGDRWPGVLDCYGSGEDAVAARERWGLRMREAEGRECG